jgi:molybdate transport system ATP-binding protein
MIAGLERPDSGLIQLNGETLFDGSIDVPPEKRRIGIIFQHPLLFPHLSTQGNLLYGLNRCPSDLRRIDFDTLVEVLQIGHLLKRGVNNLSGGEKQRVAIGRAVLSNPRLLLMDEPLSALDDSLRFQIIGHLKSVCETFSIPYLFISHSLLEMRLMADQVLNVAGGRIISCSSAEELARQRLGASQVGYINLLNLGTPSMVGTLYAYPWGASRLLLSVGSESDETMAELSSKDIILFKQHPEATSARNLMQCTVRSMFSSGRKIGVELDCSGNTLIAEVVQDAVTELNITTGSTIYAAVKASAFRMLPN